MLNRGRVKVLIIIMFLINNIILFFLGFGVICIFLKLSYGTQQFWLELNELYFSVFLRLFISIKVYCFFDLLKESWQGWRAGISDFGIIGVQIWSWVDENMAHIWERMNMFHKFFCSFFACYHNKFDGPASFQMQFYVKTVAKLFNFYVQGLF